MNLAKVFARRVTVNIHRRSDVRMPHKFLLHADRRPYRINPHTVRMPECVRSNMALARLLSMRGLTGAKSPCMNMAVSRFPWTGKDPITIRRNIGALFPDFQPSFDSGNPFFHGGRLHKVLNNSQEAYQCFRCAKITFFDN